MNLILIFLIFISIIFFCFKLIKENFDTLGLSNKTFSSDYNVFVGFDENSANDLKKKLEKIPDFDLKKSNLILKKDTNKNYTNLFLDNNKITPTGIGNILDTNNKRKIKYFNYEVDEEGAIVTEGGVQKKLPVFYNHENKIKDEVPPHELCIDNTCIEKDNLAIINGNNTVKIRSHTNNNEFIIPIYTYSGGDGNARTNIYHDDDENRKPYKFYFYQLNNLVGETDYKNIGTPAKLPYGIDNNYTFNDIGYKLPGIKYFSLFNPYSGTYMRTDVNGKNYRSNTITHECVYEFSGNWNGWDSKWIYYYFANYQMIGSPPIGIYNVAHDKWLCNNKVSCGWRGHHRCCSTQAEQNRGHFYSWEEMHLYRVYGLDLGNHVEYGMTVYIISGNCERGLSAFNDEIHFSDNFEENDPNVFGHNIWKITPIAETCSEKCKAHYNSSLSCDSRTRCYAAIESNVPKSLQCPIDRPFCKYYHGNNFLGHCSKGGPGYDYNTVKELPTASFRYAKPHQHIYRTDYSSSPSTPNEERNKDFYSEYTLKIAKNSNNKIYSPDVFKHYHKHTSDGPEPTTVSSS